MKRTMIQLLCSAAMFSPVLAPSRVIFASNEPAKTQATAADVQPATQPSKTIEVCFVLDTTGSMGGLIDGAKKKIWTIANGIVAADPKATVRFALVPYRDRGDEYVTKVIDLTDDLDAIFSELQGFKAGGGGDGPESVNQALADAVSKVSWSSSGDGVKFVFLVGDAPPHMDYSDDVKYPQTCEAAVRKGLIINTVQCGSATDVRDIWQDIARKSEGSYVALQQSGGMVVTSAPMDKEIADLSTKIAALAVPYGTEKQQQQVAAKMEVAAAAPAETVAARAAYNARGNRAIQGAGDLVSDVAEGSVKLDAVKDADLPENMRKMSADERKAYVENQSAERAKLTAQVNDLSKKREAYLAEETKKLAGKGDGFDAKVSEIVNAQMNRKK
jgi:von Willebrand factor type A domain